MEANADPGAPADDPLDALLSRASILETMAMGGVFSGNQLDGSIGALQLNTSLWAGMDRADIQAMWELLADMRRRAFTPPPGLEPW